MKKQLDFDVLKLTSKEKIQYFEERTINHPLYLQAKSELHYFMREPDAAPLIIAIGPSGAGKTHFKKKIIAQILEEEKQAMMVRPDYIPIISWDVEAPSANFSWKGFFFEGHLRLNERENIAKKKLNLNSRSVGNTGDLRRIFENAINLRGTRWIVLDEAQHFNKAASGRTAQDNLDCLKSLANNAGCQIILIGTYELRFLLNSSAQLSRRSKIVHFPRYNVLQNSQKAAQEFKICLKTFEYFLPVEEKSDLLKNWEYVYEKTIGCIGILKDWLKWSLSLALKEKSKTLEIDHLIRTAMTQKQCARMLEEAEKGEAMLIESKEVQNDLKKRLGLASISDIESECKTGNQTTSQTKRQTSIKRKATRDHINEEQKH